jgi:hypothetical protein
MQVPGANCCVVCAEMVFALVVTKVFFPGIVLDVKLPGFDSISNQEKSHFH